MQNLSRLLLVSVAAISLVGLARAQQPVQPVAYTVIQVSEMHCDGCGKRIGSKLQATPGVRAVQYDVEKKLLWVHPNPGAMLSPRALWEAVERGSDRPVMIQGPTGTFRSKPQS